MMLNLSRSLLSKNTKKRGACIICIRALDIVMRSYESRYMLRFSLFFRYYVDPSTIRHSLGSTASTVSSISQQSDGCNLVPLASSINSSSGTSKGSEMIGTTIQLQLHSKKQHNIASQMLPNSSSRY